jgi:hypothetical protein
MKYAIRILLLLLLLPQTLLAQIVDGDIWLLELTGVSRLRGGELLTATPVNITGKTGYENQPVFTLDGKAILYVARYNNQTDIYRYDLETGTTTQVTNTSESEYGPQMTPDSLGFSVVRVEADTTQRLWRYDLNGQNPTPILPSVLNAAAHAWIDAQNLAVVHFVQSPALALYNLLTGSRELIGAHVGRSLQAIPGLRSFGYLHASPDGQWMIYRVDVGTLRTSPISPPRPEREDFAFGPNRALYTADGTTVYRRPLGAGYSWQPIADLKGLGFRAISRLAVSPDGKYLALVTHKGVGG